MKLLHHEDECAPDSLEYFIKEIKEKFGADFHKIRKEGKRTEVTELCTQFQLGNFILDYNGDHPYYILYENRTQAEGIIKHNEKDFEIIKWYSCAHHYVLQVNFPNCLHGDKIMVFKQGPRRVSLEHISSINPHFGDNNSPVARFDAKQDGWANAVDFVNSKDHGISID